MSEEPDGPDGPPPRGGVRIPGATYRLQLHRGFTFRDAAGLVPYLDELGVTDLYTSPYLRARPGSMHGYDVFDHSSLNPEIGGDEDHRALTDALSARDMGHLLDIVPNHMGIGHGGNRWWVDVLEHGPSSPYAEYFDIDWTPLKPELAGKVLLPVLGRPFGLVLEEGELSLAREEGTFRLAYHDLRLPLSPRSIVPLLDLALARLREDVGEEDRLELESVATSLRKLPPRTLTDEESIRERRRESTVAARRLGTLAAASHPVRQALEAAVREINGRPGEPESFGALEALLEDQPYRLAYWRVAAEEINYRRFFDINDLAGVRVEVDEVFEATHRLILDLLEAGRVTGLRVDHPDGLYHPSAYLRRLQEEARSRTGAPTYLVVEKILTGEESLAEDWPVAGTVGYEALNRLGGLFVDRRNEGRLDRIWQEVAGPAPSFSLLAHGTKRLVLGVSLASELNVLSHLLSRISEQHRHSRDFTRGSLALALAEVVASFPVYRTYIDPETGAVSSRDRRYVEQAVAAAIRRNPSVSRAVFGFVRDTLLLDWPPELDAPARAARVRFVLKFQQLTGPVVAKGVEDTAFYRYNRLVSLNEVGGEPDRFGTPAAEFHRFARARAEAAPHAMTSTSTHDTKRSEDVRARIHLLSEMPEVWEERVRRWWEMNVPYRTEVDGLPCPDPNDEYLFYQTVLGSWPLSGEIDEAYVERLVGYMEKATREAKARTSWVNPNDAYDDGLAGFVRRVLTSGEAAGFRADVARLQRTVTPLGMMGSLSQAVLKLTMPGVPDIYQGQEAWDFSLVDPDNRRPVDYEGRRELLRRVREAAAPPSWEEGWEDGRPKVWVVHRLLRLRRERPRLFAHGDYRPLAAEGPAARHVLAFERSAGADRVVVVVPRLLGGLLRGRDPVPPGPAVWEGTVLPLERETPVRDVLAPRHHGPDPERLSLTRVLAGFPAAVLVPGE